MHTHLHLYPAISSPTHPQAVGGIVARCGMRSLFITLAPGPRGPKFFSTSVLVCVAMRTQESEVRTGSPKAEAGRTSRSRARLRIAKSRWW